MVKRGSKSTKSYVTLVMDQDLYEEVLKPLLALFATTDAVFTEDEALIDPAKAKIGFGRIYEEWKRCRKKLDPEFDPQDHERPRRWLPSQVRKHLAGTSQNSSTAKRQTSAKRSGVRKGKR